MGAQQEGAVRRRAQPANVREMRVVRNYKGRIALASKPEQALQAAFGLDREVAVDRGDRQLVRRHVQAEHAFLA